MSLDFTVFVVLLVFFGLPLLVIPWLLVIWLVRKVFGRRKDDE